MAYPPFLINPRAALLLYSFALSKTSLSMESILQGSASAAYCLSQKIPNSILRDGFSASKSSCLFSANGLSSIASSSSSSFSCLISAGRKQSVVVAANKNGRNDRRDSHSFVPRPDEATGLFPEAVLLKEVRFFIFLPPPPPFPSQLIYCGYFALSPRIFGVFFIVSSEGLMLLFWCPWFYFYHLFHFHFQNSWTYLSLKIVRRVCDRT